MWKLWHKVFGCDYVAFPYGSFILIRRVRTTPTGIKYVLPYGQFTPLDHLEGVVELT